MRPIIFITLQRLNCPAKNDLRTAGSVTRIMITAPVGRQIQAKCTRAFILRRGFLFCCTVFKASEYFARPACRALSFPGQYLRGIKSGPFVYRDQRLAERALAFPEGKIGHHFKRGGMHSR